MYVQPPSAAGASTIASQAPSAAPDTLTIETPPAPDTIPPPAATSASTAAPSQPATKRPARSRTDSHPPEEVPEPGIAPATDAAQAPPLEPASPAVSEDEIEAREASIHHSIDVLANSQTFAPADQQILEDARAFVNQSEQALKEHNLLKAHELAEKAALLLSALQAKP